MKETFDLFSFNKPERFAPLADRFRPETLSEFIGQKHLVGEGRLLRRAILAKPPCHGPLTYGHQSHAERNMNQIGG